MSPSVEEAYAESRRDLEQYFVERNRITDSPTETVSPSGVYKLSVDLYATKPQTFGVSRGIVTRIVDGVVIADVKRNYPAFPHAWVQHPNGQEYLLCGEDYQGYSVINLSTETQKVYTSEAMIAGHEFCWVAINPSPDGNTLAVEGCIWAAPYEVRFYDFTDPAAMPLPELDRIAGNYAKGVGWETPEEFVVKVNRTYRKTDGACYDDLSREAQDELDSDSALGEDRDEIVRWRRVATEGRNP